MGVCGLYPHLRWSLELKQAVWFYSSYDEGYYGWLSFNEFSFNRGLSDLVMHGLYLAAGSNTQLAMILADFILPLGATLAACYLVRPLFSHAIGMVAGALFVLMSAECLALRSTSVPYSFLSGWLQEQSVSLLGRAADIVQLGSQTSTFWLFRTPEPQVSWIIMFTVLGFALRLVLTVPDCQPPWGPLVVGSLLAGTGYLFCALPVSGVLLLFSALAIWSSRRKSLVMGTGGFLCFSTCIGLSLYAAGQFGGESLVFASRRPVLMLSALLGLLAAGIVVMRRKSERLQPADLFALALGLTPLCMANQQLLTGRMIYLMNFENFGLAQTSAFALLVAAFRRTSLSSVATDGGWPRTSGAILVSLLLGGIMLRSQVLSYANYLPENRLARSYELALKSLPDMGDFVVCDDFFQTDTLAVRLGRRPNYLIARDMTFKRPIARLKSPQELPAHSTQTRQAFYHHLALTGVTPDTLSKRLAAITDPDNPSWQDRFMLGGFLYNHADFWAPLTHGRDTKLAWIKTQQPMIVDEFAQFIRDGNTGRSPVIFIMRQDQPTPAFLTGHQAHPLIIPTSLPVALKAYSINPANTAN